MLILWNNALFGHEHESFSILIQWSYHANLLQSSESFFQLYYNQYNFRILFWPFFHPWCIELSSNGIHVAMYQGLFFLKEVGIIQFEYLNWIF